MGKNSNLKVFDYHPEQQIQESPKKAMPIIQAWIWFHENGQIPLCFSEKLYHVDRLT